MIRYIYIYDYKCKCLQIPELMLMLWDTSCHWDKKTLSEMISGVSDTRHSETSFRCGSASSRTATHGIDSGLLLKQFPGCVGCPDGQFVDNETPMLSHNPGCIPPYSRRKFRS